MVCLTDRTWYSVLDLAEKHGWQPYDSAVRDRSHGWSGGVESTPHKRDGLDLLTGIYTDEAGQLVMLEDALNLADALERAFLAYEPERLRSLLEGIPFGGLDPAHLGKPGIGVLLKLAELCQSGSFWIERD
jgi:hypothetical protein